MSDKLIVRSQHILAAGGCSQGGRDWFAAQNLDWTDFVLNGIDADILLAIDDVMAHKVVEVAKNGR